MYEVFQLDASCRRIEENGVRSFLLVGDRRALLVDTGFGTGDLRETVAGMTGLPVMLVNTHADGDHIGCNHQFLPCHMHPAEFDRYMQKRGTEEQTPKPLWEGDVIDLGGRAVEVILIPGHTPGSIALLDRENRALFAGDSIQDGRIFMFGPGRNLPAYIASLEKLGRYAEAFDTVYPSHGSVSLAGGIVNALLEGARRILGGGIQGEPVQVHGRQVTSFDVGVATFLCE